MIEPADGWVQCPRGELQRLAGRLRLRRRTQLALTILTGVLTGLLVTTFALAGVRLARDVFGSGAPARQLPHRAFDRSLSSE